MATRTLIIYHNTAAPVGCFVVNGDYTRFNGLQMSGNEQQPHFKECCEFLYDENGELKHQVYSMEDDESGIVQWGYKFGGLPLIESKEWDKVAHITFIF